MSLLFSLIETIPFLGKQLELAARRAGPDGPVSRRLRGLLGRFESVCSAEAQCDPDCTQDIVAFFAEVGQADREFTLHIADGLRVSRKSLSKIIKRSPSAPLPGTVPTWAAVLEPEYLNGVRAELRERAASCV